MVILLSGPPSNHKYRMRYSEIITEGKKVFYHFSSAHLEAGTVLEPRGQFNVHTDIEAIFEQFRPDDALPRNQVIYMMGNPSDRIFFGVGNYGFLYSVRPNGAVWRRDASIIGTLQKAHRNAVDRPHVSIVVNIDWRDKAAVQALVEAYWDGKPNPYATKKPLWEFTAASAVVGDIVEG
jgi:hypothetical protein